MFFQSFSPLLLEHTKIHKTCILRQSHSICKHKQLVPTVEPSKTLLLCLLCLFFIGSSKWHYKIIEILIMFHFIAFYLHFFVLLLFLFTLPLPIFHLCCKVFRDNGIFLFFLLKHRHTTLQSLGILGNIIDLLLQRCCFGL